MLPDESRFVMTASISVVHALRIFLTVADTQSVTRAAEQLHLSQPAVTAQLRKLEAEIGLKVIAPSGRGIRLTEAGQILYEHARRLFAWEKEIERKMKAVREGRAGTLRIASTNLPALYLLPQWLAAYKRQYPEVEVTLISGNSRHVFDQLHHYQAEVGIVAGGWDEPGITRQILCEDELWFIVPRDHIFAGQHVSLEEMMKVPFLFREEGSSTRQYLLSLCQSRQIAPPTVGLQLQGMNEAIHAVLAGYGAMLVPKLAVSHLVAANQIARVLVEDIHLKRPITWCTRQGEIPTILVEHFYGLLPQINIVQKSEFFC